MGGGRIHWADCTSAYDFASRTIQVGHHRIACNDAFTEVSMLLLLLVMSTLVLIPTPCLFSSPSGCVVFSDSAGSLGRPVSSLAPSGSSSPLLQVCRLDVTWLPNWHVHWQPMNKSKYRRKIYTICPKKKITIRLSASIAFKIVN